MSRFAANPNLMVRTGLLALTALPLQAWAHSGPGLHFDIASGLSHPFAGMDHLLVMVGVGLFAATLGGRARWQLPATFVAVMSLTAMAAMSGLVGGSPAEHLLALSVMAIGLPIALALKLSRTSALALVAVCAALHGHAHGVEIPTATLAAPYLAGLVLSTALLHAVGAFAGLALGSRSATGQVLIRGAGAAMAVAGMVLVYA
jgi:urease accessory protein